MILLLIMGICYVTSQEIPLDAREGKDVTLECRFPPSSLQYLSYWIRHSRTKGPDNVAIKDTPFGPNYKLNYHVEQGIYDLLISNTSYDRDDGRYECKVKAGGSGQDIYTQSYMLTVLARPQRPQIAPGAFVTATEGKKLELTCSSVGGSPDPQVKWYREGSDYPLEAALRNGGSKDQPTTATYALTPVKSDDGANFRCEVWNRALPPNKPLISSVSLSVHYFPRVSVGPDNPLRVERDSSVTLKCTVDANPTATAIRWMRNNRFISPNFDLVIHRVSIQDAGKYTCSADNGLGKVGEKDIILDVLFPPIVSTESRTTEAEVGESISIKCNVTANPIPFLIEWVKVKDHRSEVIDDQLDFRQAGDTLVISEVKAEHTGTYVCRAVNIIAPSGHGAQRSERVGNTTIALLIRHRPGMATISPNSVTVSEGKSVTLGCTVSPPGWPTPHYKWFGNGTNGTMLVLSTGNKFRIPIVNLTTEGTYSCQASNELGPGEMAYVYVEVHQPPNLINKLRSLETKKVRDTHFSVSCKARGKPRPIVMWLKDDNELTADHNMFEVKTDYSQSRSGAINIHSTLMFSGKARPNGNELLPSDRGVYSCKFENEEGSAGSTMHLKIEHEPIALHQYNKVAYDVKEEAEVVCRVQAYPKPEFTWFFKNNINPVTSSPSGHYHIQTTAEEDDIYTSVLKVSDIQSRDYGHFICQVANSLGLIESKIRLQPKGPPEKPNKLVALYTGPTYVTLGWEPGFNGGIHNTKYFVLYKKVPGEDDFMIEGCGPVSKHLDWAEVDCQQNVPCNVSHLDQYQTYLFKVKALNTKGIGETSQDIRATTMVDKIPIPLKVAYDKTATILSINVPATCLPLEALVETVSDDNRPITAWQVIDTLPLQVSGLVPTMKEKSLDKMMIRSFGTLMGHSLAEEPIGMEEYSSPRVRVKLCLRTHHDRCGEFVDAELGYAHSRREASALSTPTLIAIIVIGALGVISAGLLAVFCRCKRAQHIEAPQQSKDMEMDSVRPTILSSNGSDEHQHQAPPPYYAPGLDNQALDLKMVLDDQKAVYAASTQTAYGHYGEPRNDWNYLDAGYTTAIPGNSSVDSQDSLWQLKMAANCGQQYDQYGGHDDYAHYPQTQDPYAQIHRPKKRLESPAVYRDAPGLPDPYMEQIDEDKPVPPPQHMSLAYEESLESGYSTPNSRTRRVIREIIV